MTYNPHRICGYDSDKGRPGLCLHPILRPKDDRPATRDPRLADEVL